MNRLGRILFASVLLITTALYFSDPVESSDFAASQPPPQSAAPKYALLVGINLYKKDSGIKHLSGTHNDVALMRSLLAENEFKEELRTPEVTDAAPCGDQTLTSGVKTLCSAQATKQAIMDTFDNHLIKNAEAYWKDRTPDPAKGPFVVFYYSGHGSQVRDKVVLPGEKESELIKDEADNLDETIVPHDTDLVGTRDIRDDYFKAQIDKLKRFTSNIVVMSDSCHSGTISRGGPGARHVEREFPNLGARGEGEEVRDLPADNSYTTISGSEPAQLSYEEYLDDPVTKKEVRNGLLTYYFVHHMRNNPGVSYRELIGLVQSSVYFHKKGVQTPQVEGDIDRAVFGTTSGTMRKRAISVKCAASGTASVCSEKITKTNTDRSTYTARKIRMDVGHIVGAREGGSIVIYAPKATELTGDTNKIASGTITFADAFSSEAEVVLTDPKDDKDLPPLAKVVLVSPNFTDAKRVIAIDIAGADADPGRESMKRLSAKLKQSTSLAPLETSGLLARFKSPTASAAKDWKIGVVRATYADFKEGMIKKAASKDVTYADADTGYYISDAAGIPIYDLWIAADSENADTRIQDALEIHVHAENVRALANEASKLRSKLKVEMVRYKNFVPKRPCSPPAQYTAAEKNNIVRGAARISRSEAFHLNITNTSTKPLLLYIYSIDSSGTVAHIYPPGEGKETLEPGVTFSTTAGDACQVFYFDETSPTGRETIKILASETPIQANLLTRLGIRSGDKGVDSPLDKLLRSVGSGTRTVLNQGHVSDWITYDVTYTVVP